MPRRRSDGEYMSALRALGWAAPICVAELTCPARPTCHWRFRATSCSLPCAAWRVRPKWWSPSSPTGRRPAVDDAELRGPYCPAGNVPHAVVTFAANASAAPGTTVADAGRTATLSTRSSATLTVIVACLLRSACACAVTRHVPVTRAGVNTPAAVIVPHAVGTLQRTSVSLVPMTVAESCTASQAKAFTGETALMTTLLTTDTVAVSRLVGSATLVAMTWKVPAIPGAVEEPEASTVPPPASCT